ncbi:MAG: glycosyltransferase [Clostridia bacterium]|nr:glycosyltransferase [Clostridia bacterium]
MKKVLVTASTWSHIVNFHLPYLKMFQQRGWIVHVGCRGIPARAPYVDRFFELPFEKGAAVTNNVCAVLLLRQMIRAEKYDLIITHTTLAAFFTRMAAKTQRVRPQIINVVHGYLFDDETPKFKRCLLLWAELLTAPETDLLLTMNEWDYQTARQYRLGKRIKKIPGIGVDFDKLDVSAAETGKRLRASLGIPDQAFVLVFAAEFSKRKSQSVLIEAMRQLPETVWLVLCGDGVQIDACKKLAEKWFLQNRIVFPGNVADMGPWYRMADACVTSSRSEGLPFNVMEAMHFGLPVIASAVKGHTDLIQDGDTGLLYPYGNAKACADCVRLLMEKPKLREALGSHAAEATEKYMLQTVCGSIEALYLSMPSD